MHEHGGKGAVEQKQDMARELRRVVGLFGGNHLG